MLPPFRLKCKLARAFVEEGGGVYPCLASSHAVVQAVRLWCSCGGSARSSRPSYPLTPPAIPLPAALLQTARGAAASGPSGRTIIRRRLGRTRCGGSVSGGRKSGGTQVAHATAPAHEQVITDAPPTDPSPQEATAYATWSAALDGVINHNIADGQKWSKGALRWPCRACPVVPCALGGALQRQPRRASLAACRLACSWPTRPAAADITAPPARLQA